MAQQQLPNNVLCLFDFDGTITHKDSFIAFMIFTHGKIKTYSIFLLLSIPLLLHLFRLINSTRIKKMVFYLAYHNKTKSQMERWGKAFQPHMETMVRPEARQKLQELQQKKYRIAIVSASLDVWLQPYCQHHGYDIISTEVNYHNNICTGSFRTPNCRDIEKVNRIKHHYKLENYDTIWAWGDSHADKPMLELAQKQFYKPFRKTTP